MKRAAIAVSVGLSMAPSAAFAVDWSIKATQSETVEADSNLALAKIPAGSLGSFTTLSANTQALTPDSKFTFDADGSYRKFWGPGVAEFPETEYTTWGFKAHYEMDGENKFDREFVETSWRQTSTAFALLNELGINAQVNGALDRLTATGGIDRSLTALDSLSLLATSTHTNYEPSSAGTPFTDTLARGTWRHNLSSVGALTASSEVELLNFENTFNTEITMLRNQVGVETSLSPLLSFRAEAGVINIITDNGVGTSPTNGLPIAASSSLIDWIGDATLTYKMLKDTTFTATARQATGPSIVGSLFKTDTITLGLAHTINELSRLSFSASITQLTATGTASTYGSASATYSYDLTREWSAQFTYRYLHRFAVSGTTTIDPITNTPTVSGTGPADDHSIIVVVSHSLTVLPRGN